MQKNCLKKFWKLCHTQPCTICKENLKVIPNCRKKIKNLKKKKEKVEDILWENLKEKNSK